MHILILNWRDIKHPLSGGAEIVLFEHAKYWRLRGATVTWYSPMFHGAKTKEMIENIQFVRGGGRFTVYVNAAFYYVKYLRHSIDIVIDNFHFIPFFTVLYVAKFKIIVNIHEVAGDVWFHNLPYPIALLGYKIEPLILRLYRNIPFMTGSNSTQRELTDLGISTKKISVIHHGLKTMNLFRSFNKEKNPTILFLGRISVDKGIEDAIKAFNIICRTIPSCNLWIIGKEEQHNLLSNVLNKNIGNSHIRDKIRYFGFVEHIQKLQLLRRAWILVHPSKKEGWGLNVIEAASQGTPTVGYNVCGLKDSIRNGKTGILTESNIFALSEGMIKLINDTTLYREMSKLAIQWSKNFNWEKSSRKSWQLLQRVVKS